MIRTEERKLQLIESLLKENNEDILKQIEKILQTDTKTNGQKFSDFHNQLTEEELEAFEKNIQDGCEQINDDDWK